MDAVNLRLAALEQAGLLGLAEVDGCTDAYFPDRVTDLPLDGAWERVPDADWSQAWREGLEPIEVGALRVSPPWRAAPGDVVIEPAQAFGTGHHETTAGCIAALVELGVGGRRVLDVGTGTGVLAICADRLGARTVVAVDTDLEAIHAARANAAVNDVVLDVRHGSVDVAEGVFDVVVANLDTATVCRLASDLASRLAPGATLLVSGVSVERTEEALAALEAAGLSCRARPGREWTLLVCRRS
jgi:ribosomal protein L11 methyltransferase